MSGASALIEGQRITIPPGIVRSGHNASTLKPYDPLETAGDLSPSATASSLAARPPKRNKCGMFGQVLIVAVAVAVTALSQGALTGVAASVLGGASAGGMAAAGAAAASFGTAASIGGGMLAGALGAVAAQGVGIATGLQEKFSFKQVAMAGISGAVGGGLGTAIRSGGVLAGAARGAAGSAIAQGVGVATGLQSKFDFAGVAAAAVGSGVGAFAGSQFGARSFSASRTLSNHLANAGASAANAIANAAARTALSGTSFGDNLIAALPDVLGSTIGNMVAHGVALSRQPSSESLMVFGSSEAVARPTSVEPGDPPEGVTRQDIELLRGHDLGSLRLEFEDLKAQEFERLRRVQLRRQAEDRPDRRLVRIRREIASREPLLNQLNQISDRIIQGGIGRLVTIGGEQRPIRGPGYEFNTSREAAEDGTALSFYVSSVTGDAYERGGLVVRVGANRYTYRSIETGTYLEQATTYSYRRFNSVGEAIGVGSDTAPEKIPFIRFMPQAGDRVSAFFHIHPRARSSEDGTMRERPGMTWNNANAGFSDRDKATYEDARRNYPRIEAYLGGSNGSFWAILPDRGGPQELGGGGHFAVTRARARVF